MDTEAIEKAFEEMISQRGIHHTLGVEDNYVRQLRFKLKNGIGISTDVKLSLLQKSGWRQDNKAYSKEDLIAFVKFYNRTSQAARDNGVEYVFEKWEKSK